MKFIVFFRLSSSLNKTKNTHKHIHITSNGLLFCTNIFTARSFLSNLIRHLNKLGNKYEYTTKKRSKQLMQNFEQ